MMEQELFSQDLNLSSVPGIPISELSSVQAPKNGQNWRNVVCGPQFIYSRLDLHVSLNDQFVNFPTIYELPNRLPKPLPSADLRRR